MMVIPESRHGTKFDIYIFIPPASIVWVYFFMFWQLTVILESLAVSGIVNCHCLTLLFTKC